MGGLEISFALTQVKKEYMRQSRAFPVGIPCAGVLVHKYTEYPSGRLFFPHGLRFVVQKKQVDQLALDAEGVSNLSQ